nr:uncharacterized protein LOC118878033 [Drosophila suzukii]
MSDSLLLSSNSSQRRSKNLSRSSTDGDSSSRLPSIHLRRVSASILARMKCIIQQSLLVCPAASRPRTISVAPSVTFRRTVTSALAVEGKSKQPRKLHPLLAYVESNKKWNLKLMLNLGKF